MSAPLIFFHRGFEPYLAFTLWQAQHTNPGAPVWLIGDASNDLSAMGVRHFRQEKYAARRDEFVRSYQHFSSHLLENERLCFERWFYLEAILAETGVEQFCFMDSDYFLLMDVAKLSPEWKNIEVAGAPVWGFAWFGNRKIIGEFCNYMLERFRDPQQTAEWARRFAAREDFCPPENIQNVCDMTLWRMFIREKGVRYLDLSVPRHGVVFDRDFSAANGFAFRDGHKALTKRADGVFGQLEATKEPVRFAGLHLAGKYPKRLQPVFSGWPLAVLRACLRPKYLRNLRKLFQIAAYTQKVKRSFL